MVPKCCFMYNQEAQIGEDEMTKVEILLQVSFWWEKQNKKSHKKSIVHDASFKLLVLIQRKWLERTTTWTFAHLLQRNWGANCNETVASIKYEVSTTRVQYLSTEKCDNEQKHYQYQVLIPGESRECYCSYLASKQKFILKLMLFHQINGLLKC